MERSRRDWIVSDSACKRGMRSPRMPIPGHYPKRHFETPTDPNRLEVTADRDGRPESEAPRWTGEIRTQAGEVGYCEPGRNPALATPIRPSPCADGHMFYARFVLSPTGLRPL